MKKHKKKEYLIYIFNRWKLISSELESMFGHSQSHTCVKEYSQ